MTRIGEPNWQAGAQGQNPEQMSMLIDATGPDLLRLIVNLALALDVYDPAAGDYDAERALHYDLPGGAGLVRLDTVLDEGDLATLREVLDVAVDVERNADNHACDEPGGGPR